MDEARMCNILSTFSEVQMSISKSHEKKEIK